MRGRRGRPCRLATRQAISLRKRNVLITLATKVKPIKEPSS